MFKLKPIIFSSNQNSQNFCWMHKDMWGKTSEISQVILPSDIIIVPEIRYQKYAQKWIILVYEGFIQSIGLWWNILKDPHDIQQIRSIKCVHWIKIRIK